MVLLSGLEYGYVLSQVPLLWRDKINTLVQAFVVVILDKTVDVPPSLEKMLVTLLNVDPLVLQRFVKDLDFTVAFGVTNSCSSMFNPESLEQCLELFRR